MTHYKPWWVAMWTVAAAGLLSTVFLLPFRWWAVLTAVVFGTMEGVGIFVSGPYPPLTQVIRRYLPAWVAYPLIYGFVAGAADAWFRLRHPLGIALLVALGGWFTEHFREAYSRPSS